LSELYLHRYEHLLIFYPYLTIFVLPTPAGIYMVGTGKAVEESKWEGMKKNWCHV
jgi:hypothetical protein